METLEANPSATADVSRTIRKALGDKDAHVQKRALTVLEVLVEFGPREFRTTFLDEKLHTRIRYVALSEPTPPAVRRKLMLILLSWSRHFMRDPEMAKVARLYGECGGVNRVPEVGHEHGEIANIPDIVVASAPRREAPALVSQRLSVSDAEHSSVVGTIAFAEQNANELLEAIVQSKNTGHDVLLDNRVRMLLNSVLAEQRRIVSFIHVVQDEEFLSQLINTNDKVIDVLNRVQFAAAGAEVKTHPLGTIDEAEEHDIPALAFQRLSTSDSSAPNSHLSREVDAAIVTHSGFVTAAPSRGATFEDYNSDSEGDDIDLDVARRNTAAVKGSNGANLTVPGAAVPQSSPRPHAADALAPSLSDKLDMLGPAAKSD